MVGKTQVEKEGHQLGVSIYQMSDLTAQSGVLAQDVYFEGGDILRCYEGRFRFVLCGREPIEIGVDEALVIYPDQRVTIEALDRRNRLLYAIFYGAGVPEYFNGFGFFDGLHGKTSEQRIPFEAVRVRVENGENMGNPELQAYMSDALVTYAHDFRDNGNALVFNAVRKIRENLAEGIVQLKPLCERLKVSRAYLHRVFVRAGVGTPSEFIRREQLRKILRLLKGGTLSIAEISKRTGFLSQAHFSDFVHRYTGHTPRDLRR